MTRPPSILIVGSLPDPAVPESMGGTTVLLRSLLDYLDAHRIPYGLVRANPFFGRGAEARNILVTLWGVFRQIRRHDYVLVNCSRNGALFLAPLVFLMTRLAGRKMAFRAFGGSLRENLEEAPPFLRHLFERTVLRSEIVFVETKELVHYLEEEKHCPNVLWFPNSRKRRGFSAAGQYRKRFAFISHVKRSKGVLHLIEAARSLDDSYTIDVYGPIMDEGISAGDFGGSPLEYKGPLPSEEVLPTLARYDVLLLPTFYEGEGYPGIIIEGYSLGIPCITTRWKAIPEIVDDGTSGLLIEPGSTPALVDAIRSIDDRLYQALHEGAEAKFAEFDDEQVNERFLSSFK